MHPSHQKKKKVKIGRFVNMRDMSAARIPKTHTRQ